MKKKLLAIVVTLVLLFTMSATTALAGPAGGDGVVRMLSVPIEFAMDFDHNVAEWEGWHYTEY